MINRFPRILALILSLWLLAGLVGVMARGNNPKPSDPSRTDSYSRPQPTRPIRPEIPGANRWQGEVVFLEQADSLYTVPTGFMERERQIVKGTVVFRQGGMFLYCDSAYYYPQENSMDAFGHVRMEQGDTLFVYSDRAFYDGNMRRAELKSGPTQQRVRLENRDVTLVTDSLDYDMVQEKGWYNCGGEIDDKVNHLTSRRGEYSPATKMAYFNDNVVLVNNRDKFTMRTDELDYNTSTHVAEIHSPTVIEGEHDVIETSLGWYNTETDQAELTSRSIIHHRDSSDNVVTLEGDSIIYDKLTRLSRAYMFADASKLPQPMVITDTARKVILIGGYGEYDDGNRRALATHYPLLIEHSRPDTLFLRADTIISFTEMHRVFPEGKPTVFLPDSLGQPTEIPDSTVMVDKEFHTAKAYHRARFFNQSLQGVADSLTYVEYDSLLYMHGKPVVWADMRQVTGNVIHVHLNDSTADWALLPEHGLVAEQADEDFYTQLSAKRMKAFFADEKLSHLDADGNVTTIVLPMEKDSTFNKLIYAESSYLEVEMDGEGETMDRLKMWPEVTGTVTPLYMVKPAQKYLPGFKWLEGIRPKRTWYGDRWHWDDELGEIPDELEEYFNDRSDSGLQQKF